MSVILAKNSENNPGLFDVIIAPLVTEKATFGAELGKYIFEVATFATKHDVKAAIEFLYKVNVSKVNVINVLGKKKRFRGITGKRKDTKKAIVSVAAGQKISFGLES